MSEDTTDGPEVLETAPVEPQSTPDQESSPTPDVSDDAAQSETPEEGGSNAKGAKERIQQLVGDRNHALEFGKLQQERAADLQRQLETRNVPAEKAAPVMPKLEDFDYDQDAYNVSLQNFNSHQIATQVKVGVAEAMKQSSQEVAATQVDATWQANVAEFSKEHGDFAAVAYATEGIFDAIKALPDGPAIAYHLGQNPDEAQRIGLLPVEQMPFALGRLAVSSKPTVAQKQVTKAPDPMNPVGGGQPTLSKANETIDDFMTRRNAEDAEARKTRGTGRV